MIVMFKRLDHNRGIPLPDYADDGSSGMDLRACLSGDSLDLLPGERTIIPTGWAIELPSGWEGQVRPRSGLALNHGITVLNAPGTIDASYRGEIGVVLINHGQRNVTIKHGDRIAQLVVSPVIRAERFETAVLSASPRGAKGFGSTGVG